MITLSAPLAAQIETAGAQIKEAMFQAGMAMARAERARVATLVLSFARSGKKPHIIARSLGLPERHVLRILDAHRLLGVQTGPAPTGGSA
jgi:hypothetical protein